MVQELTEYFGGVCLERLANFSEFDHIHTSLAPLDLRDERLGITEAIAELDLRDPGLLAKVSQQVQQGLIVPVVCRACHVVAVVRQRTLESDSE
jgi:hypothetical protein